MISSASGVLLLSLLDREEGVPFLETGGVLSLVLIFDFFGIVRYHSQIRIILL